MLSYSVSYEAVLSAVLASFIVSWFWYSPMLFGKSYQKALGKNERHQQRGMAAGFVTWVAASIVMAFVLDNTLVAMGVTNILQGMLVAAWIWLGFILTTLAIVYKFARQPLELIWIDAGASLLGLLIMGAVLVVI